jgi:hypothetical protein
MTGDAVGADSVVDAYAADASSLHASCSARLLLT